MIDVDGLFSPFGILYDGLWRSKARTLHICLLLVLFIIRLDFCSAFSVSSLYGHDRSRSGLFVRCLLALHFPLSTPAQRKEGKGTIMRGKKCA